MSNPYETMTLSEKKAQFEAALPKNLHPKLKEAYVSASMIGPPFYWKRIKGGAYELRGFPGCALTVWQDHQDNGKWKVRFKTNEIDQEVYTSMVFPDAFRVAKEYAFDNRREFLFSDRDAFFKGRAISEKQYRILAASGYTEGLRDLTMGQAGALMDCGILRKGKTQEPEATNELPF